MQETAYPTSIIPTTSIERGGGTAAYTLVELMIAAGLTAFILAGVLSVVLLIGRSEANASNYSELESEARKALELFGREARMADSCDNVSSSGVRLHIPPIPPITTTPTWPGQNPYYVLYSFDTSGNFIRTQDSSPPTILIRNTQPFLDSTGTAMPQFNYYQYVNQAYQSGPNDGTYIYNPASQVLAIKQIEISFIAKRTSTTVKTATNKVISARFILRNKP